MNNFVSVIVAILQHAKVLTEQEAEKLVKELHAATLPDNYEAASRLLKDIFDRHEIKTIEHKVVAGVESVAKKEASKILDIKK